MLSRLVLFAMLGPNCRGQVAVPVASRSSPSLPPRWSVGEIVRGSDDETTVVGGRGALDVRETARASSQEESGIEGIRLQLGKLMDVIEVDRHE